MVIPVSFVDPSAGFTGHGAEETSGEHDNTLLPEKGMVFWHIGGVFHTEGSGKVKTVKMDYFGADSGSRDTTV